MSFLNRNHLAFQPIDPTADGLADDIAAERKEAESINLGDQLDGSLAQRWEEILEDVHQDPDWFSFAEE